MAEIYKYGEYNKQHYLEKAQQMKHEDAVAMMLLAKRILDAHNILFMPMFGTMLGIVRQNDFIPYDNDMDIGIFGNDREAFVELIPEFEQAGAKFVCCVEPLIYTFEYGTANCDFYMLMPAPKPYTRWMYNIQGHYISRRFFRSTEKIDFLGTQFDVPANPTKVLRYWYGRTWNIPLDKKGDYDSPLLIHIRIAALYNKAVRYIKRHILHTLK